MALSRVKTWGAEALLFTDQNAEFDNILNNALALVSPWTGNMAAGGYRLTGLGLGTAGSPSLQFTGDTDTGIFSSGANTLDLVTAGTSWLTLGSAGHVTLNGTTGAMRLHNLTTAQKNALTPAAGMILYDATLGRVETYDTAWRGWGSSFDLVASGTNTSAAMVLGSGSSLSTSGTGYINQLGTGTSAGRVLGNCMIAFRLEITNTGGTIQHRFIISAGNSTAPTLVGSISGVSNTLQNTPTVSSGLGFTAGGGILSGSTSIFIFDTADLAILPFGVAILEQTDGFADSLSGLSVAININSRNINGTTRSRIELQFYTQSGALALDTTNIPSGGTIAVKVFGYGGI